MTKTYAKTYAAKKKTYAVQKGTRAKLERAMNYVDCMRDYMEDMTGPELETMDIATAVMDQADYLSGRPDLTWLEYKFVLDAAERYDRLDFLHY